MLAIFSPTMPPNFTMNENCASIVKFCFMVQFGGRDQLASVPSTLSCLLLRNYQYVRSGIICEIVVGIYIRFLVSVNVIENGINDLLYIC